MCETNALSFGFGFIPVAMTCLQTASKVASGPKYHSALIVSCSIKTKIEYLAWVVLPVTSSKEAGGMEFGFPIGGK